MNLLLDISVQESEVYIEWSKRCFFDDSRIENHILTCIKCSFASLVHSGSQALLISGNPKTKATPQFPCLSREDLSLIPSTPSLPSDSLPL